MNSKKILHIKELAISFIESLSIPYSSISVTEEKNRIWVTLLPQENTSRYIGYRGQNIGAMQQLFALLLWNNGAEKDEFVVFDIDGYKKKNEEKVLEIVAQKIEKLNLTGLPQIMPFLGPQERRFVHLEIKDLYPDYQTESFTDEKKKRILRISKKVIQEKLI